MPPPIKALSPAKRAKADKRNARLRDKRAADLAASGGAKSGKKQRKMTDLAEEEIPASSGGSSSSASNTPESGTRFELLCGMYEKGLEAEKLALAEEKATFYKRPLELDGAYVGYLDWADAEKTKIIKVLGTEI
jgi:hypothetical protein